ncbi:hypothetical protein CHUAL_005875 [Chamberlinius hualienensis]
MASFCQFNRFLACKRWLGIISTVKCVSKSNIFNVNHRMAFPWSFTVNKNFRSYCTNNSNVIPNSVHLSSARKRLARVSFKKEGPLKEGFWRVCAYAVADELDLQMLQQGLIKQGVYEINEMPEDVQDAMRIAAKYKVSKEPVDIYIFKEGSVVFWNVDQTERGLILKFLKPYAVNFYEETLIDYEAETMEYSYVENGPRLTSGKFYLKQELRDTDLAKYTFSNGMALSVKLAIWEHALELFIKSIQDITQDMKGGRPIKLSRDQVVRKMGELFTLQHIVNLSSDLLDVPDFYWEREDLEPLFHKICSHMNLPKRTKVMNERLNHCQVLMHLLHDRLTDQHHVRLEIMIIGLIFLEVLFEAPHWFEMMFHSSGNV